MTEPNSSDLAKVPVATSAGGRVTRKGMWGQGSGDTSGYGGIVRSFERFPRADRNVPESGSIDLADSSTSIDETTYAELRELASRYPQPRSALLPMLHLVQSVDGRISPKGIEACAARITSWREAERVLAGFPDGLADEGPSAGEQSLLGLRVAQEKGWSAPSGPGQSSLKAASSNATDAPSEPAAQAQEAAAGVEETPEAKVPPKQRRKATKPGEGSAK